jgi:hypothetical protein
MISMAALTCEPAAVHFTSGPSFAGASESPNPSRWELVRFVPAVRRFDVLLFVGRTTSDLEVDGSPAVEKVIGETERFLVVIGRAFPFFLKKGTFICSPIDVMVVVEI